MQGSVIKILALPKYPVEGASSRYCVHQFVPWLEQAGASCVVEPFMDQELYHLSQRPGKPVQKLWRSLRCSLARLQLPFKVSKYDVVFIQRELIPALPPMLEWLLARLGTPLVFIYDDALFIRKDNINNPMLRLLKRPNKILTVFRQVDCVIGTNRYLRDYAARYARRAEFLALPEDLDQLPAKAYPGQTAKPVVIGWLGSPSTEKYLHLLDSVLTRLAQQSDFILRVVGGGSYQNPNCRVEHLAWSLAGETEALHSFDIGIMPLPDEEWSQGKSGGKARTYMAAALPAVCANIGHNRDLIRSGKTGFLAATEEEWFDPLLQLVEQPQLRQAIGQQAREYLQQELSLPRQAAQLKEILESVCR